MEWGDAGLCKLRNRLRHSSLSKRMIISSAAPNNHPASASELGHSRDTMGLTDLPYTVFVEIVSHLSARDAVAAQRISRDVRAALTRNEISITLILIHFPRSIEGRKLKGLLEKGDDAVLESVDWSAVFDRTARRYHHLSIAVPRRTQTVRILQDADFLRGVTPWNKFLKLDDKTADLHYWDTTWTADPAEGLLVYPADQLCYILLDIQTGTETEIPFRIHGKKCRRVRLSHGILIFEWCEEQPSHPLNDREAAHRHYATAYDVERRGADVVTPHQTCDLRVTFRSEWKMHYLGLPLSHQDRFFSTHNKTHYAVYIWQPTRSPWGEDQPLERLIIWHLGNKSNYMPSQDPGDQSRPQDDDGPRIVMRLVNSQLEHWGIRQNNTPSLRELQLDDCTWDAQEGSACGQLFFVQEEHRWSTGPHSSHSPPRLHHVKTTGIPICGEGPRWVDECGSAGGGPSSNRMEFCWRGEERRSKLGAGDPNLETWPGRCPCWRHDDFPYLTVCEVNDVAAGLRFSARHCFMLETLSVHIRPKLRIHGVERSPSPKSQRRGSNDSRKNSPPRSGRDMRAVFPAQEPGPRIDGPEGEEVQFADEVWAKLMGAGFICGDERWLIGQDTDGNITIMHF
ncbi:hypothetical protein K4F52_007305 [Lecanicillium sp. MT-2017a]|nr:hypothetical protein K4F52_007305 [Lecanicillium sp. MT-2017a]